MNLLRERWWPGRLGLGVATLVAVLGALESFLGTEVERPWVVGPGMVGVGIALFLRRVAPLATLSVSFGGLGIAAWLTADGSAASVLGVVAACVNVGLELRPPRLYYAPVVLAGASAIATLPPIDVPMAPIDLIAMSLLYGGSITAGWMFRQRGEHAALLADRATRLEQERESRAREAVEEERARIARELHDIVSHSISVIVVQTQAVRRRLGPEHQAEADDLRAVETVGRQAMAEMRRMLGVLRAQGNAFDLEPQPGLAQLPRLLDQTRAAGLAVDLCIEGTEAPLPPGVDLAAYRIVQEALTNVLKHAGPAQAQVTLNYGDRELDIAVEDDGHGPAGAGAGEGGNGLVGMRERVAVYGGRLEFGPVNGRGFQVRAHLPVREEALRD